MHILNINGGLFFNPADADRDAANRNRLAPPEPFIVVGIAVQNTMLAWTVMASSEIPKPATTGENDVVCVGCGKAYREHADNEACPGQESKRANEAINFFHHPDVTAPCVGEKCRVCAAREKEKTT